MATLSIIILLTATYVRQQYKGIHYCLSTATCLWQRVAMIRHTYNAVVVCLQGEMFCDVTFLETFVNLGKQLLISSTLSVRKQAVFDFKPTSTFFTECNKNLQHKILPNSVSGNQVVPREQTDRQAQRSSESLFVYKCL